MSSRNTSSKLKNDEKVHVAIRCRPLNDTEKQNKIKTAATTAPKDKEVHVTCSNNLSKAYKFDKVFGPASKQVDVYRSVVAPHIDEVLAGYNCTVLAYGQTGTGKTFTMEGERSGTDYTWENDPKAGIIPRTLSQLFDRLEKEGTEFSIHVSLLEIYNEVIYDLLSPTELPERRRIYDDGNRKGSVIIADQTEVRVLDKSEVYSILEQGAIKRRTDATLMNEFSSRSHSVFTITVHSKEITKNGFEEEELVKIGKLNLVDLAGSENIGRSGAVELRAREAGNINQSLLTLGRCITALVDHAPHIPYRESRLTRILQDSLGGATKTSIIATISPGVDNVEETLSTLDYASRAKNIQNKPRVNQKMTKKTLIKQYDNEIEHLRRELMATREKNGVYMDQKQYDDMNERLEELEATLLQRQEELANFKTMFTSITEDLRIKSEEYDILKQEFQEIHARLMDVSYLEKIKSEHGAKAVEDGSQIVTVADEMASNISKIHDKEERWKSADKKNQVSAEQHCEMVEKEVNCLNEQTQEMVQLNMIYAQNCIKTIGVLNERHEREKNEMNAILQEFKSSLNRNVSDCMDSLSAVVEKASANAEEKDKFLTNKEDAMLEAVTKMHKEYLSLQESIYAKIENMSKLSADMDSFVKKQVKKQHEMVMSQVGKVLEYNNKIIQTTEDMKKDQEQHLTTAMEAMLNSIKTQLHDIKEKQSNLRSSHSTTITTAGDHMKTCMADFASESLIIKEELEKESSEVLQESQKDMEDIKKNVDLLVEYSLEHAQQSNALLTESATHVRSVDAAMQEDLNDARSKIVLVSKDTHALASALCTDTEDIRVESDRNFSEDTESVVNFLNSTVELQNKIFDSTKSSTSKVCEQTIQFCKSGLLHVLPTGETPLRKTYPYPKDFQALPSDEDLLKSFHEKMQEENEEEESETVDEEVIDDEDEDKMSCTSDSASSGTASECIEIEEKQTAQCGGGMPFFMAGKKQNESKHQSKTHPRSRLPLRSTQNIQL